MANSYQVSNAYKRQIENRNFLAPTGFQLILSRAPKVTFFSNAANIPGLTLGEATQPTYLRDIPVPGDKIAFEDFTIRFLVDENLKNYMELQNWIRGLGYPETVKEIYDLQDEEKNLNNKDSGMMDIFSDGTLTILTSNQTSKCKVVYVSICSIKIKSCQVIWPQITENYFKDRIIVTS